MTKFASKFFGTPRIYLTLPLLACFGNVLYAIGPHDGLLQKYSPAIVAVSLIIYVIAHGTRRYGRTAMTWFAVIVFSISWFFETLSLLTGFPFGNYHYTEIMAPFIWHVPVFVLPAYAIMGYASWSLATILLRQRGYSLESTAVYTVPILAAFCMVAWDLSMDPLRATIEGRWIWLDGGAHYGIPLSNYLGWFGVTWLMFQAFALYLRNKPRDLPSGTPMGPYFWISVPIAYSNFIFEYVLNPFFQSGAGRETLVNGAIVPVEDVYADIAILCLITMVPLALLTNFVTYRRAKGSGDSETGFDQPTYAQSRKR